LILYIAHVNTNKVLSRKTPRYFTQVVRCYQISLTLHILNSTCRRGHMGMHSPTRLRGVDMTLDFIENHSQKYFCTAQYLIAKMLKINFC